MHLDTNLGAHIFIRGNDAVTHFKETIESVKWKGKFPCSIGVS